MQFDTSSPENQEHVFSRLPLAVLQHMLRQWESRQDVDPSTIERLRIAIARREGPGV